MPCPDLLLEISQRQTILNESREGKTQGEDDRDEKGGENE